MKIETLDLVDTLERLRHLCKKLSIGQILKCNPEQIEIISEIKERIQNLEVERVDPIDFINTKYEA